MKNAFLFLIFLLFPVFVFASDKVEINTASLQQLDELIGIGPVLAQKIIDARPFSSVDDLLKVKGIGEKTLQKIKDQGLAYVENPNDQPATISPKASLGGETPKVYSSGIIISEILPSPEGADEKGEWIELQNSNNFEVDLSGWKIEDIEGTKTAYIFPDGTKIPADGYLVLKRPETKITLNNSADGLNLFWPDGKIADSVNYTTAPKNQSYSKVGESWVWSLSLTPGAENIISRPKNAAGGILPKSKNSDNNNIEKIKNSNPWFLFFTAMILTIISAVIILIIKFKFKNYERA